MLFIHDHTFLRNNGATYTTGSLNQGIMDRYLNWFSNVSVFATTRTTNVEKDVAFINEKNKVENIDFKLVQKSHSPLRLMQYAKLIEQAVRKADYVVVRMSIFGAIGVHYARRWHVPYLVEMVACPWDSLWYHGTKGKIVAPWMALLTKRVCKVAPYVLYVTSEFLQRRYPTNGLSVGCSDVDLPKVEEATLQRRLSKIQSKSQAEPLRLVTVANVEVRYKGQETVIKAVSKLRQRGINVEYNLVGGGSSQRLEQLTKKLEIQDYVHFLGPQAHDDIFGILNRMDIYVQPSFQEGLPRAVVEAMSQGCPVIGSTAGGIPELLESDCVFQKGSVNQLVKAIVGFNQKKMETQAKRNYLKATEFEATQLEKCRTDFYTTFRNHFS
ncbi:glycosyltransferase [Lacticaseibacillus paracasei]|uniref:glycosyltransferase n=1 Tax=Lacticaseibacillus paracasei TaxID=1597 RepID=UPI0031F4FF6F